MEQEKSYYGAVYRGPFLPSRPGNGPCNDSCASSYRNMVPLNSGAGLPREICWLAIPSLESCPAPPKMP